MEQANHATCCVLCPSHIAELDHGRQITQAFTETFEVCEKSILRRGLALMHLFNAFEPETIGPLTLVQRHLNVIAFCD